MTVQSILESLPKADATAQISIVNHNLDTLARAVAASGQTANAYLLGHGIKLQLPVVDALDATVDKIPPRQHKASQTASTAYTHVH